MASTETKVSADELEGFPTDPSMSYNPTKSLIGKLADSSSSETEFKVTATKTAAAPNQPEEKTEPGPIVFPKSLPGPGSSPSNLARKLAFDLRRKVGQGAFGEVWEATQQNLGRTVAVKRLRASIFNHESDRAEKIRILEAEFKQEALTTARLDHPNIVPVHDVSHDEAGRMMIAMKLVRGLSWKKSIDDDFNTMSVQDFLAKHLSILVGVSQAVAFAHSRCVIHRDIKPHQVMLGKFGEVVLMDWGLAMTFGTPEMKADITLFKLPGTAPEAHAVNPAGTPAFMAPEQTDPHILRIGPWTDVYLLGGTLYFLLTRTYPHFSSDANIAFELARNGQVSRPEERNPNREVPPELSDLCMKAMHPEPAMRMQKAEDFIAGLKEYLSGSGRRREAMELMKQAQAIVASENKTYEKLSEGSLLMARSMGLWPDNPEAKKTKQELIHSFALTAMKNNDLLLARFQAERLENQLQSKKILADITVAQDKMRETMDKPRVLTSKRLGILVVVQIVILLAIHLLVSAARNTVLEESTARAKEIAVIVAGQVNAVDLAEIREKADMASLAFRRVHQILQRAQMASPDVRNIYTIRPDPDGNQDKFIYVVSARTRDEDLNNDGRITSEEQGGTAGMPRDMTDSEVSKAMDHALVESRFAFERKGTLMTAYAPILNPETHKTTAILAVDIDADAVQKKMYNINIAGMIAGGLLIMLITAAMLASFRLLHIMHVNKTLDEQMRAQTSELQRGNISLS
ncbi:serine/threonine protein kinase [Candidatus Sumerlaeota bacterium]|nr:serine/threonine protein kinase [Candidatus Sumerlaeota bacterium]